ncbi:MAG: tRNA pseudouridine(38-40) synthase TruA [Chloroflexi bacterium]|nr:tRNA pseudouridine(38-40) synthase TruA [Chloroflexota bacterium]
MPRTLRLTLAYEGTRYAGFSLQPGRTTIQEVVEGALTQCLGETIRVTAAGRTDAGVHASGQVVSFATRGRLAPAEVRRALNALLPEDVVVETAAAAPDWFDARRSATRRHYRYVIWNQPRRSLWWRRWAWHVPDPLDVPSMQEAASALLGRHDFASFASQAAREPAGHSTERVVEQAAWWSEAGLLGFEITATAFLRHMVRGIVGTLVQVGRGQLSASALPSVLAARDRRRAGPNAPPHGLMLTGVEYPATIDYTGPVDQPSADGSRDDRSAGDQSERFSARWGAIAPAHMTGVLRGVTG